MSMFRKSPHKLEVEKREEALKRALRRAIKLDAQADAVFAALEEWVDGKIEDARRDMIDRIEKRGVYDRYY